MSDWSDLPADVSGSPADLSDLSGLLSANAQSELLDVLPLDPHDVVSGEPSTFLTELDTLGGVEIGLWEITPGTVRDTEADEVFVVLSGEGTVRFADGRALELGPGIVARLRAGERTEWEIRSTLRKVYITVA